MRSFKVVTGSLSKQTQAAFKQEIWRLHLDVVL
jgi:hypothetical protein